MRGPVIRTALVSLCAAALVAGLTACSRNPTFVAPPPPPVTVSTPLVAPVQDAAEFTGQASASLTVDLVARVAGFLKEVRFADGADVTKGQLLFQIEPDQYEAQVTLSQASVDQQQANLKSAEVDFDRKSTLQRQLAASQADYDKALATRDTARAAVAEAQANLKIAQLNLSYTRMRRRSRGGSAAASSTPAISSAKVPRPSSPPSRRSTRSTCISTSTSVTSCGSGRT